MSGFSASRDLAAIASPGLGSERYPGLDLLIAHETNGIRFTELDRQRLNPPVAGR